MIDWNLQSRAHACQECGRAFQSRQAYHTLLFDEKLGYRRLDVCDPCWQGQFSQGASDRKGFVSHWQGVYQVPPIRPEPIQKENAESLLRKLAEQDDPKYTAARFILAVMLERKRILKVQAQTWREGRRVFAYERAKTGDLFTILDPDLQLSQLEEVQRDVSHLLEHGLPAAAAQPLPAEVPAGAGNGGSPVPEPDPAPDPSVAQPTPV